MLDKLPQNYEAKGIGSQMEKNAASKKLQYAAVAERNELALVRDYGTFESPPGTVLYQAPSLTGRILNDLGKWE